LSDAWVIGQVESVAHAVGWHAKCADGSLSPSGRQCPRCRSTCWT